MDLQAISVSSHVDDDSSCLCGTALAAYILLLAHEPTSRYCCKHSDQSSLSLILFATTLCFLPSKSLDKVRGGQPSIFQHLNPFLPQLTMATIVRFIFSLSNSPVSRCQHCPGWSHSGSHFADCVNAAGRPFGAEREKRMQWQPDNTVCIESG